MNKRDRYLLQKIKENKNIALFIIFGLAALGVFISSFFLRVELIVPIRIVSIIIILIPPFLILVVYPLFSLLFEGICGDKTPLGRKILEDKSHTSLVADDPKEIDWLFSDERLYGKVFTEQYEDLTRGRVHPDPRTDDKLERKGRKDRKKKN